MALSFSVSILKPLLLLVTLSILGCTRGLARCLERERLALLDFKRSFVSFDQNDDKLSSWNSSQEKNCCVWDGITCDNHTGHVTSLNLSSRGLISHQLRPSLLELQHLRRLVLSHNDFAMRIPEFIGSLSELRELYLVDAGFSGKIPPHLGNLSNIQSIYLGVNQLYVDNLQWISHLSSLKYLDMRSNNVSEARDWLYTIKKLPSLYYFGCSFCSLPPPAFSSTPDDQVNSSTSLNILFLRGNQLEGGIFKSIGNFCNLALLFASNCSLKQSLVQVLQTLGSSCSSTSLRLLDLSGNNFGGMIPPMLQFSSLTYLNQGGNRLDSFPPQKSTLHQHSSSDFINGSLPCFPASLTDLLLHSNSLNGVLSHVHFANLSQLVELDLANNPNLSINFSKPSCQIQRIHLRSCKLGPNFPSWLLTQNSFFVLDISNSVISDSIPTMFWENLPSTLQYLNLSFNKFHDIVPNLPFHFSFSRLVIDLSSNAFFGPIPFLLIEASTLLLSNNNFSGFAPFPQSNNFSTSIPSTQLSNFTDTPNFLDFSDNSLSGMIPHWLWFQLPKLGGLSLANNSLSGTIPNLTVSPSELYVLSLRDNDFSGPLPLWLKNCTKLRILEFSGNKFSGSVPPWMGEDLKNLVVLSLQSNDLIGTLPSSLCHMIFLQILDVSHNKIWGNIPSCVNKLTAMAHDVNLSSATDVFMDTYESIVSKSSTFTEYDSLALEEASFYSAFIMWKGMDRKFFRKNLQLVKLIDLSSNNLSGEIPSGLTSLSQLISLDLSSNNLHGSIPEQIGPLKSLEVLNLCCNRLSGQIPSSLSDISSLSTLNFSQNNLSGRIPTSTQLQLFDSSAFAGNPELCGLPLPIKCPGDVDSVGVHQPAENDETGKENEWTDIQCRYAGLGTGFAFGFLVILGTLTLISKWRYAFFQFASRFADWILVLVELRISKITRNFCTK